MPLTAKSSLRISHRGRFPVAEPLLLYTPVTLALRSGIPLVIPLFLVVFVLTIQDGRENGLDS